MSSSRRVLTTPWIESGVLKRLQGRETGAICGVHAQILTYDLSAHYATLFDGFVTCKSYITEEVIKSIFRKRNEYNSEDDYRDVPERPKDLEGKVVSIIKAVVAPRVDVDPMRVEIIVEDMAIWGGDFERSLGVDNRELNDNRDVRQLLASLHAEGLRVYAMEGLQSEDEGNGDAEMVLEKVEVVRESLPRRREMLESLANISNEWKIGIDDIESQLNGSRNPGREESLYSDADTLTVEDDNSPSLRSPNGDGQQAARTTENRSKYHVGEGVQNNELTFQASESMPETLFETQDVGEEVTQKRPKIATQMEDIEDEEEEEALAPARGKGLLATQFKVGEEEKMGPRNGGDMLEALADHKKTGIDKPLPEDSDKVLKIYTQVDDVDLPRTVQVEDKDLVNAARLLTNLSSTVDRGDSRNVAAEESGTVESRDRAVEGAKEVFAQANITQALEETCAKSAGLGTAVSDGQPVDVSYVDKKPDIVDGDRLLWKNLAKRGDLSRKFESLSNARTGLFEIQDLRVTSKTEGCRGPPFDGAERRERNVEETLFGGGKRIGIPECDVIKMTGKTMGGVDGDRTRLSASAALHPPSRETGEIIETGKSQINEPAPNESRAFVDVERNASGVEDTLNANKTGKEDLGTDWGTGSRAKRVLDFVRKMASLRKSRPWAAIFSTGGKVIGRKRPHSDESSPDDAFAQGENNTKWQAKATRYNP